MSYKSIDHPLMKSTAWRPADPAYRINDHIIGSCGTTNSYVILSDAGDVVINTGMAFEGPRHRERFEQFAGRPLKVKKIILTQSHADHVSGWTAFGDPGVEIIVQRDFPWIWRERNLLNPFFMPRIGRVLAALLPKPKPGQEKAPPAPPPPPAREPEPLTFVADKASFEVGGRRFEVLSAPSGETLDSLWVWIPDEKTLFVGNWAGALYGALPNFYTLRGDRVRSVPGFIRDIDRILALDVELLITGHDAAIVGNRNVVADLGKLRAAVSHIHDETVKGMCANKDLPTLMREITLPADITMAPGRGIVPWYVRAVWEEYAGWFHQDSTTELYPVPASTIWPELREMAGGANALAERARRHVAAGRPVEALHFVEIALAGNAAHKPALEAQRAALALLLERTKGQAFDEVGWLESEIARVEAALQDAS